MCAIAGYYIRDTYRAESAPIRRSLTAMRHRGPDDEGITFIDPERNRYRNVLTDNSASEVRRHGHRCENNEIPHRIAFGHRRFSIVDVSAGGHQPFWSADGKVCVAFNGEIYNYVELRQELEQDGFSFHTSSDTEVLALAYRAWGVRCFERFNGFWAVSLYDTDRRQMLLARDRIGKAPLYVTRRTDGLYWASEIKGLFALLNLSQLGVNEQVVVDFVRWHRRDLFHETFYKEICSFPNAAYAWIENDGSYRPLTYWNLPTRRLSVRDISVKHATESLKTLLGDAVRLRLRADVPVSVQLSGGMDSSSLLALAAQNATRVHAYTVAFPEKEANEEPFARKVAERYAGRVDYSVIEPPPEDILAHADSYISLMGEPFHSPNQFSSHRIWRTMARDGFRATLYGAGGDEVFAGYPVDYFPAYLRSLLKAGRGIRFAKEFLLFSQHRSGGLGIDYLRRGGQVVLPTLTRTLPGAARLYHMLAKDRIPPECDPFVPPRGVCPNVGPSGDFDQRMIDFMTHWQMNYWLRIDNQNSMGVPMELRLPFLDYRVVEFGFTLPAEFLIHDGWLKWILRSTMEESLPQDVVWRKQKMGFPFPLRQWLGQFKNRILSMIQPLDSPYLDMKKFSAGYETLRERDTAYLWCLVSLAMWWKRCIQGDRLVSPAPTSLAASA